MGHTSKSVSHFFKFVTFGKKVHTRKNVSQLEKWVTLEKIGHT